METASVFNPRNWNQTLRRRLLVGEPLTEEFLDVSTNPLGQGGLGSLLLGEVFQNEGNDVGLMLTLDSAHHAVDFGFRGFMLVAINHFPRYPWTKHRGVDIVLKALYNFMIVEVLMKDENVTSSKIRRPYMIHVCQMILISPDTVPWYSYAYNNYDIRCVHI